MSSAPSRSSPNAFEAAIAAAASLILDRIAGARAPIVLIDGRSGSGKTTLAGLVGGGRPGSVVVALDDLYPGWDGLDAGVAEARERVLVPRTRGESATWRRWDWAASAPAEEHAVAATAPLIVEGSGVLTPATAPLADLTVWLESPDAARKQRALGRDGDLYRPHWDRWAAQEDRHLARDRPQDLADLRLAIP